MGTTSFISHRARSGDSGLSFDGAVKAAQDVRCGAADIRKRELRRPNPAFRERTGRPARRPRCRARRRARRALVPHHAKHVPRPGRPLRFGAHVREERRLGALPAQQGKGPAHASRPKQREGVDELDGETDQAWLDKHPGVTPDGWDSRELLEQSKDDGTQTFDDEDWVGVLRIRV